MKKFRYLVYLLLLLALPAQAELRIEVTKGVDNAVRVAVVPFAWRGPGGLPEDVTNVIDSDLTLSGRFDTLPVNQMLSLPNQPKDVFPRDWRLLKVEYLVIGYLTPAPIQAGAATSTPAAGNAAPIQGGDDGRVRLHFALYNVYKQAVELQQTIEGTRDHLRDMAHYVSDAVFKSLTGIDGAFSTQIMYVTVTGKIPNQHYQLNIADADGHRVRTILRSDEPVLSATWAPDGKRIAYVSFERGDRPAIYMRELDTGKVQQLTNFEGLNGAPAFSPDGKKLAMVLSKDGNPDIYILDLETRRLRRITRHYAIDTEPSFTPDGKSIVFTSDRGGKPQIYMMHLADLSIERLTFEGDYNAKATMLPDGSGLVLVHRRNGIFHIALMDLKRGRFTVLTKTALDESPSVAPNGSMLIYATQVGGKGILAAVSIDGGVKFNLPSSEGDVREPAWSPVKRMTFQPVSQ